MRIAAFVLDGRPRLGTVVEDHVAQLLPPNTDVLDVLAATPDARAELVASARGLGSVELSSVRPLPPLRPTAMRDFLTFEEHVQGVSLAVQGEPIQSEWYDAPGFLFMNPHAVIATGEPVEKPHGTERLDFELEVAAVMARDARNVSSAEAHACIGGYLIMNDWSARDLMRREMRLGLGPSKGKDFATTLGPWIVTADELAPYERDGHVDLEMQVSVNGVRVGGDRTSNMSWSFAELVTYAARGAWVRAGDVLASGTCATGALAETWGRTGTLVPAPLEAGDTVSMTVEGLGTISNTVVAPQYPDAPIPRARTSSRTEGRA